MTITTTQKIIKIGTSRGVTLPAKQLKALGVREGSEVKITVDAIQRSNVLDEYERFKEQYGETLRNLADR